MRGANRRGIILGIVVLTSAMLAVFLFAYNYTVRRQNIRAHFEQIGEVGATLAKTGVNLLFEEVSSGFDTMILAAAPTLVGSVLTSNSLTIEDSDVSGSICAKVRDDFDHYLSQLTNLSGGAYSHTPRCMKMEIAFENIQQLNPILPTDGVDEVRLRLQAGRDAVEKSGEAVVSCTVEYQSLRRKAQIRRQFRVVSMVPGPFARFSLFVPYTPYANSYNALGVFFNGTIDGSYQHPHPTPQHFSGALKLINGTDSYIVGTMPDPKTDLQNRGWVFLGPAYDPPTNATSAVILRIPSGYDASSGGHFQFSQPKVQNGLSIVNTEQIDTALYNTAPNATTTSVMLGGTFQGFYTNSHNAGVPTGVGAAGQGLWSDLDAIRPWECASSWIMPYGDRNSPSRTLMIGPVLAGFLKYYFLKEGGSSPTWGFILKGLSETVYDPVTQVQAADKPTPTISPLYQELFKPTGGEAKTGFRNFLKVMPFNSVPHITTVPLAEGVAFNALFDFMEYNVGHYPLYHEGSMVMQANVANEFYVPSFGRMTVPTPPASVKGIHPWDDVKIKFNETDGVIPQDNLYF
ncbi:MAG TPA: hypothetical protein PKO06_11530, partial [Candidatus Ozemobacteraceae bacterium]|nr:hypothetical protein [Candidatus Ozemobacteraceae bacterium]